MPAWEAIAEGLWAIEKVSRSGWSWRALAARSSDGELLLVSPIRKALEPASLEAIGRPAFALAPNYFHYLGLADAKASWPELSLVASDPARPRIAAKTGRALAPLDAVRERLPRGVELLEPAGLKTGEVWLRAETARGVAWAVCDAFFHVNNPLRGTTGLALRATGTAPGLRIGGTFGWLHLDDRAAYKRWLLDRLEADAPRVLVPSHGDVLADDALAERLARLARARL